METYYSFKRNIDYIVKDIININDIHFQSFMFIYFMPSFKKFKRKELIENLTFSLQMIDNRIKESTKEYELKILYSDYTSFVKDIIDYCIVKNKNIEGYASSSTKLLFRGKLFSPITTQLSAIIGGVGFKLMYCALRKSIITYYCLLYLENIHYDEAKNLSVKIYQESIRKGITEITDFFF